MPWAVREEAEKIWRKGRWETAHDKLPSLHQLSEGERSARGRGGCLPAPHSPLSQLGWHSPELSVVTGSALPSVGPHAPSKPCSLLKTEFQSQGAAAVCFLEMTQKQVPERPSNFQPEEGTGQQLVQSLRPRPGPTCQAYPPRPLRCPFGHPTAPSCPLLEPPDPGCARRRVWS